MGVSGPYRTTHCHNSKDHNLSLQYRLCLQSSLDSQRFDVRRLSKYLKTKNIFVHPRQGTTVVLEFGMVGDQATWPASFDDLGHATRNDPPINKHGMKKRSRIFSNCMQVDATFGTSPLRPLSSILWLVNPLKCMPTRRHIT
jgi:hypothetical protein